MVAELELPEAPEALVVPDPVDPPDLLVPEVTPELLDPLVVLVVLEPQEVCNQFLKLINALHS